MKNIPKLRQPDTLIIQSDNENKSTTLRGLKVANNLIQTDHFE